MRASIRQNHRSSTEVPRWSLYTGVGMLLLAWWVFAFLVGRDILLPSPAVVARSLVEIVLSDSFVAIVAASLVRWVWGLTIAFVLATVFGAIASRRGWIAGLLRPLVVTVRSVPVIAIILLALIWLPVGVVPVFVSLLVSFPLLYQGILDGLRSVDRDLVDMGRLFRIHWLRRMWHIHVAAALPVVLPVITSVVGVSWKAVIAAEVLSQPVRAIGTDMQLAKLYLETPAVIAWTVIAVTIAALGDTVIWSIDRRVNAWRNPASRRDGSSPTTGHTDELTPRRILAGGAVEEAIREVIGQAEESGSAGPGVVLEDVSFSFPGTPVFERLSLEIPPGRVTAILGRSGSGKTSLLRLIAGDLRPREGCVRIDNTPFTAAPVGFVFQEPRLIPWRSILDNVELVLPRVRATDERNRRRAALASFLMSLRLPEPAMHPATLSGGMRHRVNLARGFLCGAPVICMDEPFSSQDMATREGLVELTRLFERALGKTVIIVTHDPEEALQLADTIVVLADRQPTSVLARFKVEQRTEDHLNLLRTSIRETLKTR
jgi:ABC-type nitrate/sulfonate/bicarbonate transport system ATPase subunit/ABC-type nitrate/sulfonate/bicarbonate transport system permease component